MSFRFGPLPSTRNIKSKKSISNHATRIKRDTCVLSTGTSTQSCSPAGQTPHSKDHQARPQGGGEVHHSCHMHPRGCCHAGVHPRAPICTHVASTTSSSKAQTPPVVLVTNLSCFCTPQAFQLIMRLHPACFKLIMRLHPACFKLIMRPHAACFQLIMPTSALTEADNERFFFELLDDSTAPAHPASSRSHS